MAHSTEAGGITLAAILRDHLGSLRLGPQQRRVAYALLACRTGQLGGHVLVCDSCPERRYAYHSCRDRHCPHCGALDQALWAEAQQQHLLPGSYYHVVFTIPRCLHPLFRLAPAVCFEALFAAVSQTLLEVAQSRLKARLGLLCLLHTWNQKMEYHPHLHCLATGGGLADDGARFVHCRRFLLPLKVLREVFAGKLLGRLDAAREQGAFGPHFAKSALLAATRQPWNIKVKRPLAGPAQVIAYFARYTRRIAISESRLRRYDGETVTFTWRDRADGNRRKLLSLPAPEFLRRFFLHVLPPRFVRIRRYGLLANRVRETALACARRALDADNIAPPPPKNESRAAACLRLFGKDPTLCPACKQGHLVAVYEWRPTAYPVEIAAVLATIQPRAP